MNNNNINPTKLISNRLRDVSSTQHASRLAECTTIESSLHSAANNTSSNTNEEDDGVHPLAKLANKRSYNPQPPLDDGITGVKKVSPQDARRLVSEVTKLTQNIREMIDIS